MRKVLVLLSVIFIIALVKLTKSQSIPSVLENAPRISSQTFFCRIFNYGVGSGVFVSSAIVKQFNRRLPLNPKADFKAAMDFLNDGIFKLI
jgi:hypothetical protein